jgi:hypothetical protein
LFQAATQSGSIARRLEPSRLVEQHAEIGAHRGVVRLASYRLAEIALRRRGLALLLLDLRHVAVGGCEGRVGGDGALEGRQRLVSLTLRLQHHADVVVPLGVVGVDRHHLAEFGKRLIVLSLAIEQESEADARVGEVRFDCERAPVVLLCLVEPAAIERDLPEDVLGVLRRPPGLEIGLECRGGVLVVLHLVLRPGEIEVRDAEVLARFDRLPELGGGLGVLP